MARISGPLLDRIDIHIEVPAVPFQELSSNQPGTSSASMRESVEAARSIQAKRFQGQPTYNAQMSSRQLREFCQLDKSCSHLLRDSCTELGLSARAHDKILRVARTIADLEASPAIQMHHLQEAINYRMLDRNLFDQSNCSNRWLHLALTPVRQGNRLNTIAPLGFPAITSAWMLRYRTAAVGTAHLQGIGFHLVSDCFRFLLDHAQQIDKVLGES